MALTCRAGRLCRASGRPVWSHVADLEAFEDRARARIGAIQRRPPGPPAQGTVWSGKADVMGKKRDVTVTAATIETWSRLTAEAATDGMQVNIDVDLAELGPRLTRLTVTTEARARSLAARLMLQSAKLARKTLAKRYKGRISDLAARIEKSAAKG